MNATEHHCYHHWAMWWLGAIKEQAITWTTVDQGPWYHMASSGAINTLNLRQNGRHLPDDSLKWIFLNENELIPINISLKFVPTGRINKIPAMVLILAWRRSGEKLLSKQIMDSLMMHIYITQPQWVNAFPWCLMMSPGGNKLMSPMNGKYVITYRNIQTINFLSYHKHEICSMSPKAYSSGTR